MRSTWLLERSDSSWGNHKIVHPELELLKPLANGAKITWSRYIRYRKA